MESILELASVGGVQCVLVVDDDDDAGSLLAHMLRTPTRRAVLARSGAEALELVRHNQEIALVLTCNQMAGMDGITLCTLLGDVIPDAPVIVLSGHGQLDTVDTVVRALRAGAYDFLMQPVEPPRLAMAIERALEHRRLCNDVRRLKAQVEAPLVARTLLGSSSAMREVLSLIGRVASTDATVLIEGESGTGKELAARALHDASQRHDGPFVAINCAAVPPQLLESELFGHVRGAFTDAHANRTGLFLEARGGTLFLDEIGEMPLDMQSKLLRALQERTVRPVGGRGEVPFDARIVAATNRSLEREVREKRFREDLYYRIAVVGLHVPTLRERMEDIPGLAQHFIRRYADRFGKRVLGLSAPALQRLLAYPWPGNVRELENAMERAVALTRFEHLTVEDLPRRMVVHAPESALPVSIGGEGLISLAELSRRYTHQVLALVGGNKSQAARVLGLDRRTLYRMFDRERAPASSPSVPCPSDEPCPEAAPTLPSGRSS